MLGMFFPKILQFPSYKCSEKHRLIFSHKFMQGNPMFYIYFCRQNHEEFIYPYTFMFGNLRVKILIFFYKFVWGREAYILISFTNSCEEKICTHFPGEFMWGKAYKLIYFTNSCKERIYPHFSLQINGRKCIYSYWFDVIVFHMW